MTIDTLILTRAVEALLYVWAASTNAWVFKQGVRLNKQGGYTAWLYPLCIALTSVLQITRHTFYTYSGGGAAFMDYAGLAMAPLFALTGYQAVRRISEMEEGGQDGEVHQ